MINSENGRVQIKGSLGSIMPELSCIVKSLKDSDVSEEDIREAVELGLLTDEELDKKHKEVMEECEKDINECKERIRSGLEEIMRKLFE